jgi:bud site selection protein 20
MQDHFKTKKHKLRLKALEMDPYTIEESERAAGKGNFIQPKKRKMETQPTKDELASGSKSVKVEYLTEAELAAVEEKKRKRQKTDKDGDVTMKWEHLAQVYINNWFRFKYISFVL